MRTLTRYLLRAHVGPFFFAFTALTGLLFLNAVTQRLQDLVGKGLSWRVIGDFALLSLPHTVALTLPMAVLVAVLYTFSDLTANQEITAMAAGGVKPARILFPLLLAGLALTVVMFFFNNQVLPEANHRLKNLLVELGNKSPTFELQEQVLNDIRTQTGQGQYYLQAARIDRRTNQLFDVAIYNVSPRGGRETTYADSGSMAFNQDGTDLFLTLHHGEVFEVPDDEPGSFRRVQFEKEVVPIRGVGNVLQRNTSSSRSDREMDIAMLSRNVREKEAQRADLARQVRQRSVEAVEQALGIAEQDSATAAADAAAARQQVARPAEFRRPDQLTRRTATRIRTDASQAEALALAADRYRVEIHKKYAISFACLVFVLIGAPIAVRFPRGGVGMTIAVSVGVFAIYWMGLIGGEKLADKGIVPPAPAMWTPDVIFFALGLFMSLRMGRWIATARGGGWDDLVFTAKRILARPLRILQGGTA